MPEAIDAALLRSGRLERPIALDLPDEKERLDILQFHLKPTDDIAKLKEIATDLERWNAADMDMIAREAGMSRKEMNNPASPTIAAGI